MRVPKLEENSEKSPFRIFEFFLFFALCVVMIGACLIYNNIYRTHQNSALNRTLTELFSLPAGSINGDWIYYDDVFELDQMAQVQYPGEDHFARAFDAAVREKLLEQLKAELGVDPQPTWQDVDEEDYQIYGWTRSDYDRHVLEPLALSFLLQDSVLSCELCQQDVRMEMEHVASLLDSGIEFSDLAIQYSQVASSQFGGDIGLIGYENLDEGLKELWDYELGKRSGIIELDDSYVIAQVYDIVSSGEKRDLIGVEMIVLYKNELSEVISQKKETSKIKMF
ncbi:MAG: hypothetical protein UU40_C0007G0029 [Candidatus Uhrbacteria bacterium GW2011_GWD2_41_121]|uniref:PpiC domain-containing protein n=1 Tax=Candidatus Uhrbacteria bacterium GW2011_GWC1_41_20 TaxID=1618983 RepID=A0A0G0VHU9_9BACT|nr:MAG: hypothetical protein UT52_C0010G0029 [Candidatus Uhrbacteria bacterium GW2011_GWE1_39_46]KKR63914.1 MAG: hypothetical protein UU04_C0009G0023 [Candidatus Uhrbacteria bacterium GW2011_GWC2_40_450]KKR90174.1 MAG: hypothetical protein UU40_C0007G0029 [Candidatus Uhrbacteria bacterium GW2011_GWD2_41_121]KKR90545.1 MAG: hypothetical protein UU36_C0004G0007 [Candidatus Uhrbacteria bacterium GW2011_GWE2_41_1153]KKR96123.1 MAG: hypothetical protein UU46_C0007G0022 [Candidatus Uhrbacteria bacter